MLFANNKTKAAHLATGEQAEQLAEKHLLKHGLKLVCRNFRCKHGELDLIMTDQQALVIIEVRYRKTDRFGSATESITPTKQARIIAATQTYLMANKINPPLRFDVVALSGDGRLEWVKNAF
ncbi:MAG: YraN family protein [Methylovulum miyakonense]|uniref:YraN family protein n=1 Tax=Methylovulum miyakonense TaxID=645578 RepID=UPI003BB6A79B